MVLSRTRQKLLEEALYLARQTLADGQPQQADPDYEGKRSIRQEHRRLNAEQIEQLVAEYRAGATTYQLAKHWQIHRHTVTAHLERAGEPIRRPFLTPEQLVEAAELWAEGWSINRLARKYGMDPKTMKSRLISI